MEKLVNSLRDDLDYGVWEDLNQLLSHYFARDLDPGEFERSSRYVLEYTWEQLHTGHWKNVPDHWRVAYACIRILRGLYILPGGSEALNKLAQRELLKSALPEFDYSLLLGYPVFDAVATRLASAIHELIEDEIDFQPPIEKRQKQDDHDLDAAGSSPPSLDAFDVGNRPVRALERISRPSLEKFLHLLAQGQPFILTGAMDFWPACQTRNNNRGWSVQSWRRRVGHRLVPIEIGSRYTDEAWGQELMTVSAFIDRYVNNGTGSNESKQPIGYLAQHQLFLQIPELGEDVFTPDYCMVSGMTNTDEATVDSNVWFGPAGTVSPLHHDSDRANLLTQIQGWKYVILYTADQTLLLYPHKDQMLCNTSQVDAEHPDLVEFPKFRQAEGFHGVLGPGEMLFIPPRCWHYIRALTVSFSVNFWWNVLSDFIPPWPTSDCSSQD
ncbi:unnamed protein product [Echinostoma caproni]|uniref:JmjC domain-containing protein n=1 Tax=Echinostoma caproni TaxID=27848 RepID=A0A3P8HNK1_9TREM|nr:unnamed protein product [Echinostoma caproni]